MTHADEFADDFEPAPPDKLALYHRRQLSAMLDGEVSPDEAKFMLRRLQHDHELAACWERWQVCGDVLRGRGHALLPGDFSQRVARAIAAGEGADAPAAAADSHQVRRGLPRLAARVALVASVAVVALWAGRQLPGGIVPDTGADAGSAVATTMTGPPTTDARGPADTAAAVVTRHAPAASTVATADAVAQLPPRTERRSRGQSQRAAIRVQERAGAERAPLLAVGTPAGTSVSPGTLPVQGAGGLSADPFAAGAMAPSRPWPRAVMPGLPMGSGLVASYPATAGPQGSFHPFEPRLQAADATPREPGPQPTSGDEAGAGRSVPDAP